MWTEARYHRGIPLDMSDGTFGSLRESADIVDDGPALRRRLAEDGYLYLPGYLDREKVLYGGAMMEFYRRLFGEEARPFDFTWHRAKTDSRDSAAQPHCDIVFMGRGSHHLCTSWTPLGDIPAEMGGLMVLEGSCHLEHIRSTYGTLDVDHYCTNYDDAAEIEAGSKIWQDWVNNGSYNVNASETRRELGGRWLTTDHAAGDLLVFGMFTMHAGMDNHPARFRLSTDTRYQPVSDPVDERWIGEHPIRHGPESKVGHIC